MLWEMQLITIYSTTSFERDVAIPYPEKLVQLKIESIHRGIFMTRRGVLTLALSIAYKADFITHGFTHMFFNELPRFLRAIN